jgi:hypothetical protein
MAGHAIACNHREPSEMTYPTSHRHTPWLVAALLASVSGTALAQSSAPAPTPAPAAEPASSGLMIDGITLSGQINAGFMMNPFRPNTGLNFGHLFTDRANAAALNQILLTVKKDIDLTSPEFQWGFKLQGMFGTDARFTQYLGIMNHVSPNSRYQPDIVEANVLVRLPIFQGGMDIKAGLYPTPIGYETIDPATNLFYSHSYIFQFGLPFKHTGVLTVSHVSPMLDIYAGLDTGTNTTFGTLGENNGAIGGILGAGLNLMDGKLTILGLTHMGPEGATRALSPIGINANGKWRFFNDVLITYKATEDLTFVTELNWVREQFNPVNGKAANAFGVAQYVSYALSETISLNARAELWRDDNNFFVASFAGNSDPIRFQQGLPARSPVYAAPGTNTTYGSLTLGLTWKPELPVSFATVAVRPEIRWDHAFTNNRPFNNNGATNTGGTANNFTFGADIVLSF